MRLYLKIIAGLIFLSFIVIINSCEKNVAQPASLPAGCDTANLTYTNAMQVIINSNCGSGNTSCHAPGISRRGDFSNYASLQYYASGGEKSLMWRYIFVQKKMPLMPELPLDACTSNKFRAWLLAGAPQ
ncbi:MAG: hypothetical protein ACLQQ4_10470 [Bacteroidia bacterium]